MLLMVGDIILANLNNFLSENPLDQSRGLIYLGFGMESTAAIYARETSTKVGEGVLSGADNVVANLNNSLSQKTHNQQW